MKRIVNYAPGKGATIILGALPLILIAAVYLASSQARLAINPNDKLMPSPASFIAAMGRMAGQTDPLSGETLFWLDTWLSLARLFTSLGISLVLGLVGGVLVGFIPYLRSSFGPALAVLSLIPPLAILPILFIVFGLGEFSKIVLIVFGIAPFIMRDIAIRVSELPREQIIKAQTLGASTWQMIVHVVLPQVLPRLIDALRLSLGAAWLFLIAAEAIASQGGLGYRIFLVRRYLAMDVILPYVAWITLLAFIMDYALRRLSIAAFPWNNVREN
ncbi:MAG: ABC transporter permease subunit [Parvibaculaceae bacterium]|nr:ABC transporter permease subunit [Parvibaculaceae bacterium]